jgi:chitosanase
MADRIRLAAFNITAGFESIGYASFQAEDSGIVSYGRFQTTLASGNLEQVLQLYLSRAAGHFADVLREQYIPRVRARDASLRFDTGFRDLLLRLARDPAMQQAQNDQATRSLWGLVRSYSINPRGVSTALGQALLFDMSVNHGAAGSERYYLQEVERVLRVRPKSMLGANGVDERDFIRRVAEFRRDRLYVIAAQRGWGGLRPRGDFWVDRVWADDWDLQGDADGAVQVKEGVRVRVRQP